MAPKKLADNAPLVVEDVCTVKGLKLKEPIVLPVVQQLKAKYFKVAACEPWLRQLINGRQSYDDELAAAIKTVVADATLLIQEAREKKIKDANAALQKNVAKVTAVASKYKNDEIALDDDSDVDGKSEPEHSRDKKKRSAAMSITACKDRTFQVCLMKGRPPLLVHSYMYMCNTRSDHVILRMSVAHFLRQTSVERVS